MKPKYKVRKIRKSKTKPVKITIPALKRENVAIHYIFPSEIVRAFNTIRNWTEGITAGHIKKRDGRDWTIHEQLCHVQSEITEVYEAIRWSKCDKEITEEMVDVVFSAFTVFNIFRSNKLREMSKTDYNQLIDESVKTVLFRVQARLKDNNYNMGSKVGKLEK